MVFPIVIYRCWNLDHKEGRPLKNWCFQIVVLEKTLESPLESKDIQPVNFKGNQPWRLTKRTDTEAPVFWPPDEKSQLSGKDPDAWKDWRQKKRVTEDEMVGWHHWCNGHELEKTPGDSEGQSGLKFCSPWSHKELDTTWQLNNNSLMVLLFWHGIKNYYKFCYLKQHKCIFSVSVDNNIRSTTG